MLIECYIQVPPKQEPVDVIQQPMIVGTSNDSASVIIQEPILQVSLLFLYFNNNIRVPNDVSRYLRFLNDDDHE